MNYIDQILELCNKPEMQGKMQGKICHITVLHDDDCPLLSDGICTCTPDLKLERIATHAR